MEHKTPYEKIEELSRTFGLRLKERREEAGLSIVDLAKLYSDVDPNRYNSISRSTIYEYEGVKEPLRTPVSYTHLDVYKRQMPHTAN